jgi:PKD repeat protein
MLVCSHLFFIAIGLSGCGGGGSSGPTAPPNVAPVARFVALPVISTGHEVTLNGSGSTDPENGTLVYAWNFVSIPNNSLSVLTGTGTQTPAFIPDMDGSYTVQLTVTDAAGLSNSAAVTMNATSDTNLAPVIRSLTTNAVSVAPLTSVRFDWKVVDPNAEAVSCALDPVGDGTSILISDCLGTQSASYTYSAAGKYRPRLTAIDARSASSTLQISQEVTGSPTILSVTPTDNAFVTRQVAVKVFVQSILDISSVTARVGSTALVLHLANAPACVSPACTAVFEGVMDLTGMAEGKLTLEVSVRDVQGRIGLHYQALNFDDAAALTVASPKEDSVATPLIALSAACTDAGTQGCTIKVSSGQIELASGREAISQVLDLSAYAGTTVALKFVATDSRNQTTETTRSVYVENSGKLNAVATTDGAIIDVQGQRVLYKSTSALGESLHVLDRGTGAVTDVPVPAAKTITLAYLSNFGAVFVTRDFDASVLAHKIYDWNRGVLSDLGFPNSALSLQVSGNYAIWSDGPVLWRRDLATQVNTTLSSLAGNWKNGIASNGTVAWWSVGYQIHVFNGATQRITNDAMWNTYVLTDGQFSVYRKHTPCCVNQTYAITVFDGSSEKTLRSATAIQPLPGVDYQVRDRWVAYTDIGNLGQTSVWTFDALGNKVQRTAFAASATIDTLGDGGSVMILAGNKRYLSNHSAALLDVGSNLGKAHYVNNQWFVSIGSVLFEVRN